jgi:hypothetical protein
MKWQWALLFAMSELLIRLAYAASDDGKNEMAVGLLFPVVTHNLTFLSLASCILHHQKMRETQETYQNKIRTFAISCGTTVVARFLCVSSQET